MRPLIRPWLPPTFFPRLPRASFRALKTSTKLTNTKHESGIEDKPTKKQDASIILTNSPILLPKIVVTPGSAHHNSLPSYIEYAKRVGLEPDKSVFIGTHYEYVVALALLRLGFSLIRTGGAFDLGIDLLGHWTLSQFTHQIPVIVQCKCWASKLTFIGPRNIRELEGAFRGRPAGWRNMDVLGLLVTTQRATRGVLNALGMSKKPMGFIRVSQVGKIEQFVWNRAAAERGLEGVGVTLRYTPKIPPLAPVGVYQGVEGADWVMGKVKNEKKRKPTDTGADTDIQLTWMGSPIFPGRDDLASATKDLIKVPNKEICRPVGRPRGSLDSRPRDRTGYSSPRGGRPKGSKDKVPRTGRLGRQKGAKNKVSRAKIVNTGQLGHPKGPGDLAPRKSRGRSKAKSD